MENEVEQIRMENIADTDSEIFALLKQRYSPRIFKKRRIDESDLDQIFEAGRWSASSNNLQPWRFVFAEKGTKAYQLIYDCLSDFNKTWANNAPLLMLTAFQKNTKDGKENFHALHDLGLCLGNVTVQAQYLGIGLHHMAGVDWKKAHRIFKVPNNFHITTAIAMGYYGGALNDLPPDLQEEEIAQRERNPVKTFAYKESWGG
ncbi:nitroreductase family protein [Tamlana crocina]